MDMTGFYQDTRMHVTADRSHFGACVFPTIHDEVDEGQKGTESFDEKQSEEGEEDRVGERISASVEAEEKNAGEGEEEDGHARHVRVRRSRRSAPEQTERRTRI